MGHLAGVRAGAVAGGRCLSLPRLRARCPLLPLCAHTPRLVPVACHGAHVPPVGTSGRPVCMHHACMRLACARGGLPSRMRRRHASCGVMCGRAGRARRAMQDVGVGGCVLLACWSYEGNEGVHRLCGACSVRVLRCSASAAGTMATLLAWRVVAPWAAMHTMPPQCRTESVGCSRINIPSFRACAQGARARTAQACIFAVCTIVGVILQCCGSQARVECTHCHCQVAVRATPLFHVLCVRVLLQYSRGTRERRAQRTGHGCMVLCVWMCGWVGRPSANRAQQLRRAVHTLWTADCPSRVDSTRRPRPPASRSDVNGFRCRSL